MIKVLLAIISLILLFFLESFFLRLFSFSLFIISVISMYRRVDDIVLYPFVLLFGLILDSVLLTPLGVHSGVIAVLLILVDIFWFFIPRDSKAGYIGVFLFVSLYRILVTVLGSLLLYGVFPKILISTWIGVLAVGLISTLICIFIDRFTKSIRGNQKIGVIRLS